METQRRQYESCGRVVEKPDFDKEEGKDAEAWLLEFVQSDRGRQGAGGFTTEDVETALRRMRECAPGIDGISKRWVVPLRSLIVPLLKVVYSFIYAHGVPIDDWELAIVASVKKSGSSLMDMSNMRGVHVLQFFRQLYVSPLLPELDELSRRVVPDAQQGFVGGGFIGASYLALHALVEQAQFQFQCSISISQFQLSILYNLLVYY